MRKAEPAPGAAAAQGEDSFGLVGRLLHRDGLILILDKPAGVPVHRGPKGGPCLEDGFHVLRFGLPAAPALAHRLDRDTSGCLVLGRHRKALARLGRLFSAGRVEKVYWAVTVGRPTAEVGTIDQPLAKRSTAKEGWWMQADPAGVAAVTDWRVLGTGGDLAWLELRPRTGRTHQVRVHCAELGCPVLGDPIYGRARQPQPLPPLHLHARAIGLPLHERRPPVHVTAPPPQHMLAMLAACGYRAEPAPAAAEPANAPIDP